MIVDTVGDCTVELSGGGGPFVWSASSSSLMVLR